MDILMIALLILGSLFCLAFVILFGPPPFPIGIIPLRIMAKHVEEVEQRRKDQEQQRIDEELVAHKASDQAKRKGVDKAYWNALVAVDRARYRFKFRDSVSPEVNRRLRHLMID